MAFLCAAIASDAFALNPGTLLTQYVHEAWQTDHGLPENTVFAITQTRDGYLWIGTREGLARFDGARFSVFDKSNTPGFRSAAISSLLEDRNGWLWIGTLGGGVARMRQGQIDFFTAKDGLAGDVVFSLCESSDGAMWIGSESGVSEYRGGRFHTYSTPDGLVHNRVNSILEDSSGAMWFGTQRGLSRFHHGRFENFYRRHGLASEVVQSLHRDRSGRVWIGTSLGLNRWTGAGIEPRVILPGELIWAIREDRDSNLWLGTENHGIVRWRDGRLNSLPSSQGLSHNQVTALTEDREGNLWVGTGGGGLNRLSDGAFRTYSVPEGLTADVVWSVGERQQGGVWIGTQQDLYSFHDGRFDHYINTKKGDRTVLSVMEDSRGRVWVGRRDGLDVLFNGNFISRTLPGRTPQDEVVCLQAGSSDDMWIGTALGAGLFHYSGDGTLIRFTQQDGLASSRVRAVLRARDGSLWIGARGGGLDRMRNGRVQHYGIQEGLSSASVWALHEDKAGVLWIATGAGLNRLKDGRITAFGPAHGMPVYAFQHILEDDRGYLWIGSRKGVLRVSKRDLANQDGDAHQRAIVTEYGKADGIRAGGCNGGVQPGACKTRDGKLWFATDRGVAVVDPAQLPVNPVPPNVVIEEAFADRKQLALQSGIQLAPGRHDLEIRYTAPSFRAVRRVRFQYRLEGFDPDWVDAGGRRSAYYDNLPPGRYRFRVKASNGDGVWSETGASVPVVQNAEFHQTPGFYVACALLMGSAGFCLYRLRLAHVKARFCAILEERTRISREIHDTLAQGFAAISVQLESAEDNWSNDPVSAHGNLQVASKVSRSSLAEARQLIRGLRHDRSGTSDLASAIGDAVKGLPWGIGTQIQVRAVGSVRRLEPEVEYHLMRVSQEATCNALKHSGANQVHVELKFDSKSVWLRVRDNGRGFDPVTLSGSCAGRFGLSGMRERMESIGGSLQILSQPGAGTEISATIAARPGSTLAREILET